MGYKIRVDHSKFVKTAKIIDDYTVEMKTKMDSADSEMESLFAFWVGNDSSSFRKKWNSVNDNSSTYGKMKKSLTNYSAFLKQIGEKYCRAQAEAINRANHLPR